MIYQNQFGTNLLWLFAHT